MIRIPLSYPKTIIWIPAEGQYVGRITVVINN